MIFLKTEKLNRKEDKLMRKEAFISLFLERLVRALDLLIRLKRKECDR